MTELPLKIEAVVYRENEGRIEYLLLKRTDQDGGFWQPITGTVEDGEKLLECLRREIKEETGISKIEVLSDVLHTFDWRKSSGDAIVEFVFAVQVSPHLEVKLNPEEHTGYAWHAYDQALQTLCTDNNKKAFKIVNNFLLKNP